MELFSRRIQTTVSAQWSNMYGMMPCDCYTNFFVCVREREREREREGGREGGRREMEMIVRAAAV